MLAKYTDPALQKKYEAKGEVAPVPLGAVRVEFFSEASLGVKTIRQFVHRFTGEGYHTGIAITQQPVSSQGQKIAAGLAPNILEYFQETDLVVNITMHELVPKHVLLSIEEKNQLLERYRLRESQLPRIQKSDPVAKYLGLRRGQVVKIIRKSTTAGRYASYRWVMG
jgi:DNA-directed RNA polymerase I, II, and III subunit RPABC1